MSHICAFSISVSTMRAACSPAMPAGDGYRIATSTCGSSSPTTPTWSGPLRPGATRGTGSSLWPALQPPNTSRTTASACLASNVPATIRVALLAV
jgi:hypothetical protein